MSLWSSDNVAWSRNYALLHCTMSDLLSLRAPSNSPLGFRLFWPRFGQRPDRRCAGDRATQNIDGKRDPNIFVFSRREVLWRPSENPPNFAFAPVG